MLKDIVAMAGTILILAVGATAVAQAQSADKSVAGEITAVKVSGTVKAVDRQTRTVTLVGPQGGTLTLVVRDPEKLDAVKVGDPVVATYYEALVIEVRPGGAAKAGISVADAMVTTKPGEIPAAAFESQVTLTAAITAVDAKQGTVTIKGLEGDAETVKARDPKMLAGVKAGDLVQLTYNRALAVALDKPAGR
jgi:Cu/Ag efflux protein CusF